MNDRFRISSLWAQRLTEHKLALPTLLRLAGLPAGFFEQEKSTPRRLNFSRYGVPLAR